MAFQLEWSIEGDKQLSRRLLGLDGSLKDYTTPFRESADFLKTLFSRDVFETEGRAIGEKWKRLSPVHGITEGPHLRSDEAADSDWQHEGELSRHASHQTKRSSTTRPRISNITSRRSRGRTFHAA